MLYMSWVISVIELCVDYVLIIDNDRRVIMMIRIYTFIITIMRLLLLTQPSGMRVSFRFEFEHLLPIHILLRQ